MVSGLLELILIAAFLLRARMCAAAAAKGFSSSVFRCRFRVLHLVWSAARTSQDIASTLTAFICLSCRHPCISDGGGQWLSYPMYVRSPQTMFCGCDHPPQVTDASHVVVVEWSLLPGTCSPCHSDTQRCAGNAGIANNYICLHPKLRVCRYLSRETSNN